MENNQPLTVADLAKFTEEVLLPALDERFERLESEMQARFSDVNSELASIKRELAWVKAKLESLEKMAKEDAAMLTGDVVALKEKVKNLDLRIAALEGK